MIIHTMPQHLDAGEANPEWLNVRKGKLTASESKALTSFTPDQFKVIRPSGTTLKSLDTREEAVQVLEEQLKNPRAMKGDWTIVEEPFKSGPGRETYISNVAAVRANLQRPDFIPPTYWMERGTELEPEARGWFQIEMGLRVRECGFIESDDGLAGFSPDGYIGNDDEIIPCEFKVPKPSTHLKWLKAGILPDEHVDQVHFDMAITGAPHAWFMSYCPGVRQLLIKVERDEYTEKMVEAIDFAKRDLIEYMELAS